MAKFYFESHVTIEPVFENRLDLFKTICQKHRFRVADLLMQKRKNDKPERSKHDSFCTSRSKLFYQIKQDTINLVLELKENGFDVWRYKIEDTMMDSKIDDEYGLLGNKNGNRSDNN